MTTTEDPGFRHRAALRARPDGSIRVTTEPAARIEQSKIRGQRPRRFSSALLTIGKTALAAAGLRPPVCRRLRHGIERGCNDAEQCCERKQCRNKTRSSHGFFPLFGD
jgi:hypothetical protein